MNKRNGRPMWQRRMLWLVSPKWRATERGVADFARLVALAERAERAPLYDRYLQMAQDAEGEQ